MMAESDRDKARWFGGDTALKPLQITAVPFGFVKYTIA